MKTMLVSYLIVAIAVQPLYGRIERGAGGNNRVAVQNRSTGVNRNDNLNRTYNGNVNRNVNANVNRNVNVNVNRNVNVDVHGGYYGGCCYHQDNDWNWGSFAAGAAVGVATTAVVAAATRPSTTVVTNTVAVGSLIPSLPGGCTTVATGSAVIYHCSNVFYRPYYQGSSLVYQVVMYP
jgi:hypothetical protein